MALNNRHALAPAGGADILQPHRLVLALPVALRAVAAVPRSAWWWQALLTLAGGCTVGSKVTVVLISLPSLSGVLKHDDSM
jgi:hypothetical protein